MIGLFFDIVIALLIFAIFMLTIFLVVYCYRSYNRFSTILQNTKLAKFMVLQESQQQKKYPPLVDQFTIM